MDTDVNPDFPTPHVVVGGLSLIFVRNDANDTTTKRETSASRGKIEASLPYYGQNEPAF